MAAFLSTNPPPPSSDPNTLDTILILRLEDGADIFISLRGTLLPSCFGMDLDRLLTCGDSPVLAVENLDAEGQQLLRQGLQPPLLPPAAAAAAASVGQGLQNLDQQTGGPGPGQGSTEAAGVVGWGSPWVPDKAQSCSGLESRVPKEVQRLVHFLEVSSSPPWHRLA